MCKCLVAFLILFFARDLGAATNDYYSVGLAKELVDKVINAYGGAEKLKGVERLKLVMDMSYGAQKMRVTVFQTATKIRREVSPAGQSQAMAQVFDGTNGFTESTVVPLPASRQQLNATAQNELEAALKRGLGMAVLFDRYLNASNHVRYLGAQEFQGKSYEAIETLDKKGAAVVHYFDPKTYRESVEITKAPEGDEIQFYESFKELDGVFYPAKTVTKKADGATLGSMELVEISKSFDDSVFVRKIAKRRGE